MKINDLSKKGKKMNTIFQNIKGLFKKSNKGVFVKRKSKVIIGRALQKLDKCEIMGDNVPYAVLKHFSSHGV